MKANENEYRMQSMFYEGDLHYHIEQFRKGKWRLIAGDFSYNEAKFIIDNNAGDTVKEQMDHATKVIIITFIICILGLLFGKFFIN